MTKIAYMMSRFPKLTETFILYEMLEMQQMGAQIELFPLVRQQDPIQHPEAAEFVAKAHFTTLANPALWWSQLVWLAQTPLRYLAVWWAVLWGNRRSAKFLLRSVPATLLGAHFARQMQTLGIDHIHAHWATHATLAAFVIHRLTDIPYSFTGHAHDIYVETTMLDQKIRDAAFAVTISEHNRALLADRYGSQLGGKIEVVRCGVDTAVFTPHSNGRSPNDQPGKRPLQLIAIGRLEEKKGHRYLIDACHLLAERGLVFTCTIIGSGPLRAALQTQINELALEDHITLAGHKTRAEVQQMLAAADVMMMPSVRLPSGKQEGIPVALMEGLAMQKAAVATDISGIPELIIDGETGLLVPQRQPQALADAVQRLAQDADLREQLGKSGRSHVLRHFDLRQNARQLYHRIQQTHGHAAAQATQAAV